MGELMNDQVNRPAPQDVTDALDSSVRDLASGAVSDARSVQTEARRVLADYNCAHTGKPIITNILDEPVFRVNAQLISRRRTWVTRGTFAHTL